MCRLCDRIEDWAAAREAGEQHALVILDDDGDQARVRCSCGVEFNSCADRMENMVNVGDQPQPWCPVAHAETATADRVARYIESTTKPTGATRPHRSRIEERLKVMAEIMRGDWR